ncbi:hypothetical protein QLX67_12680 [Balneolaceae bacterium ANBcel3]|nr:hypothetical protein [Balneolaceae bacterium ANBcel3]
MKKLNLYTVLTALLFLSMGVMSHAHAQFQSDFQIKQNFDHDHAQILDGLKTIESAEEAEALEEQVDEMEDRYRDYQFLLDQVLYPESLDSRITNLRELAQATSMRISRIGEKGETIVVLEERIVELTSDATRYQERAEELNSELGAMRRSRDAHAAQARRLRQDLDQRDAFIIKMIDSTFVAYNDVDLASLSPAERRELALEIDAQNVFGYIETVVDNNIAFLDTHTELSTADFIKLYDVQVEFDRMWNNMGADLAEIYVSETNREERLADIVEKVDEWGMLIDNAAWSALSDAFAQSNINLDPFSNSLQFYTALNTYLDTAIARAEEEGGEEELERYYQFADLWFNEIKTNWQQYMISANLMTYDNFNTIDEKLADWKLHAQPDPSRNLLLLGIAVLIALILLGLWLKERSSK